MLWKLTFCIETSLEPLSSDFAAGAEVVEDVAGTEAIEIINEFNNNSFT